MAIKRPDEYEHSNPDLSVVDSDNVRGALKIVANQSAMLAIPSDKLKEGSIVKYQSGGKYISWELQNELDVSNISSWKQLDDVNEKVNSSDYQEAIGIDAEYWRDALLIQNVDNTLDINKPISTATENELNKKVDFNDYESGENIDTGAWGDALGLDDKADATATQNALDLKANKSNIFASTATGSKVGDISAFIKDIRVVSGLDEDTRYYLYEISEITNGYKIVILNENNQDAYNKGFTYTPPTDSPYKLNDVVEKTDGNNDVTLQFTFDWSKYNTLAWNTTSLTGYELNNSLIFGSKLVDLPLKADTTYVDSEITTEETARILGDANSIKNASIKGKTNVFRAGVTSDDIGLLEQFFLEFEAVEGFDENTRYYIDEFKEEGSGYKIAILDENNANVLVRTFTYTPPIDAVERAQDVVTWSWSGVTVRITFNWNNYLAVSFGSTSLESHELSNDALFGRKMTERDALIDANTANIVVNANENTATRNLIGVNNALPNVVQNTNFETGWGLNGAVTITDGVVYMSNSDQNLFQNDLVISKPIGTKFVFTAKMKSVTSTDFFMSVQVVYDDASFDLFRIYKDSYDSFLREDGYYQLLQYYTATKAVVSINVAIDASFSNGNINYNATEGVYLKEPYISSYEVGQEAYFLTQDYFPIAKLYDWSNYSLFAKDVEVTLKEEIKQSAIDYLNNYDTSNLIINHLGDSYTQIAFENNRGWINFAADFLQLDVATNFNNFGIGGTWISNRSSTPDPEDSQSMVNRYLSMPKSDVLGILGGFNDSAPPFNTWEEKIGSIATKTDITTIWGAYCTIIEGRKNLYPYSNCITFLMTYPYTKGEANKVLLNETIREIADYYNLPLLDFEVLAGIVHEFNASLNRPNLIDGYTFIPERRIGFDGYEIWNEIDNPASQASGYSYIADFIPVDVSLYKYLHVPSNCNLFQYKHNGGSTGTDADYDYLGYNLENTVYEYGLHPDCTHFRYDIHTSRTHLKVTIADGEFVTDGTHLNLLGNRRVAPIYTEFMRSIIQRLKFN